MGERQSVQIGPRHAIEDEHFIPAEPVDAPKGFDFGPTKRGKPICEPSLFPSAPKPGQAAQRRQLKRAAILLDLIAPALVRAVNTGVVIPELPRRQRQPVGALVKSAPSSEARLKITVMNEG